MNEPQPPEFSHDGPDPDDPVLAQSGARLRERVAPLSGPTIEASVLRRRTRRLAVLAGSACAVVAVLASVLVIGWSDDADHTAVPAGSDATPDERAEADLLLARLDDQPVDPTEVQLVSSVSTFDDCDALIGDLRRVGAEHVGSRGFGGTGLIGYGYRLQEGASLEAGRATADLSLPPSADGGGGDAGTTLGTNVQVTGVDELDHVKAAGDRIYDLDGAGNLRITDASSLEVVSTIDVTPAPIGGGDADRTSVSQLLVAGDRVAVFGSETEISDPVAGDPSATQAATSFLTVTFVDAIDAAAPTVTDRVRVEGRLVSARLVDGEVRLVTTSDMADLGFVMPTTPTSVAKALEQNRRAVALSEAADWIPDWQRAGEDPTPLVPCERVHVPDTFAGVAMTSMVTFPIGSGTFEPAATSILAPGDTLYAGLEKVAISSSVWVDPIDRERLRFDDWQTAVHEFSFAESRGPDNTAPGYEGSGIVDGSTVGQFAFGEIGDSLGVVTTTGTPWAQDLSDNSVDLVVLRRDGAGGLAQEAKVEDLASGEGAVGAVRFVDGRVLVSTGFLGRQVRVVDVSDPAAPRKGGAVGLPGATGYFHPLPDDQALLIGARSDEVGSGDERRKRVWVQAHLLDVADPDSPQIVSTWERPWATDQVGYDHHAFTFWPERSLAMWGIVDAQAIFGGGGAPNVAAVLRVDDVVTEVAVPVANKPNEVPPPCEEVAITEPEIREMVGTNGRVLRCDGDRDRVEWPRYGCYAVDRGTVARYSPDAPEGSYFVCSPAPQPVVLRVLVVDGRPILFTDQTLEALDPETFASTAIAYHPSERGGFEG